MKVVSWNIENALPRLAALPAVVEELGAPDVLCLQELRIRRNDADAVSALETALPGYRCHYALARDSRNVTFRGGRMYGVATFVRGRWRGEVPAWDLKGRVVVVRKRGLAIVKVYAVKGTTKPYFDEMGRVAGDRHQRSSSGCPRCCGQSTHDYPQHLTRVGGARHKSTRRTAAPA